jgi:hypothetical protein
VLINPATSFESSPWPALGPLLTQLPDDVYKLLPGAAHRPPSAQPACHLPNRPPIPFPWSLKRPFPAPPTPLPSPTPSPLPLPAVALSPVLANPLAMARRAVASRDPPAQQAADLLYGLLELLPELSSLRVVLPPATLAWRLSLLTEGAKAVNPSLSKVARTPWLLRPTRLGVTWLFAESFRSADPEPQLRLSAIARHSRCTPAL